MYSKYTSTSCPLIAGSYLDFPNNIVLILSPAERFLIDSKSNSFITDSNKSNNDECNQYSCIIFTCFFILLNIIYNPA